jgi:hypothetical protein
MTDLGTIARVNKWHAAEIATRDARIRELEAQLETTSKGFERRRIAELEDALRVIARFTNVPSDSSAWSVFMMVPEELRPHYRRSQSDRETAK